MYGTINGLPKACGVYTCDAALGDVPLTQALYVRSLIGALGDFQQQQVLGDWELELTLAEVTCIPTEEFMNYDLPLLLTAKMPNLISIGDRAFKGFAGGTFKFVSLDESYLPKLEHVGVEAFGEFDPAKMTEAAIVLQNMPSLISIGSNAFANLLAPYLLLNVECACSSLEVIGEYAFASLAYGPTSKIIFTDLSRIQSIGSHAFIGLFGTIGSSSHAYSNLYLVFTGVSPLLTKIGAKAFR
jgi:hypothetical protein